MKQTNYLPNSLAYLGCWLSKCDLNRSPDDDIIKINVSILNLNLNKNTNQFTVTYQFQLISKSENKSVVQYICLFDVNNKPFFDNFIKKIEDDTTELTEENKSLILLMLRTSFPYIRQALFSLTNDLCTPINLPISDVKDLLDNGLEFTRKSQPE